MTETLHRPNNQEIRTGLIIPEYMSAIQERAQRTRSGGRIDAETLSRSQSITENAPEMQEITPEMILDAQNIRHIASLMPDQMVEKILEGERIGVYDCGGSFQLQPVAKPLENN